MKHHVTMTENSIQECILATTYSSKKTFIFHSPKQIASLSYQCVIAKSKKTNGEQDYCLLEQPTLYQPCGL